MTNEMIIFNERTKLLNEGKISGTGRTITIETNEGKISVPEPEEIHTFQMWKSLGFSVKKGEHAIAKFPIWKYTKKDADPETLTEAEEKIFMKIAAFFTIAQVEPIKGGE